MKYLSLIILLCLTGCWVNPVSDTCNEPNQHIEFDDGVIPMPVCHTTEPDRSVTIDFTRPLQPPKDTGK